MADLFVVPNLHRSLRSEAAPDPLRDAFAAHVCEATLALLDPDRIEALGEDLGIVRKHRVHHAGLLVCAMVLSALEHGADTEGRWLDIQTTYRRLGGPDSGTTSIRKMGRRMRPLLKAIMKRRMAEIVSETRDERLRGRLRTFADVLIPDGCAFKIASLLSGIYPGTGQPAELKLHAVYSVKAGTAVSVTQTAGSVHDSDGFWPKKWEKGALYLWDLGYVCHERFIDAVTSGAVVLQRLKEGANPIALASYGPTGARRDLVDEDGRPLRLNVACQLGYVHHQRILDLDVEIADERARKVIARVVCVPFDGKDRYYLTTLPRDVFTPHDVAELYRVRWEVELFFKGWKGGARLDHVHRLSNAESLDTAVTASMLAALLSRDLHARLDRVAQQATPDNDVARSDAFSPGARGTRTAVR
jgi:putative transposase